MGEIWLPQWDRRNLGGPTGGAYDNEYKIKVLWHTWEGTSWAGAEGAFKPYPPHVAYKFGERPRQYVPLDLRAYALAGTEAEDEFVIQVELAGFAHEMRYASKEYLEAVGRDVLAPILFFHDVPDVHLQFCDALDGMGTLAWTRSRIRLSMPAWEVFSGHCGHQHAPPPDEHWDPGHFDVETVIRAARQLVAAPWQPKEKRKVNAIFSDKTSKETTIAELRDDGIVYLRNVRDNSPWYNTGPLPKDAGKPMSMDADQRDDDTIDVSVRTDKGVTWHNGFPPGRGFLGWYVPK